MDLSYVLPLGCPDGHGAHVELAGYLREIAELGVEVLVVDNSGPLAFADHRAAFGAITSVRHLPTEIRTANGKVGNVLTGLRRARHDRVVIADDDVRHDGRTLAELSRRLERADLVVPANAFSPLPWHARWDTGRTLLNRALWFDYPGTLGVRRSTVLAIGGYAGDVMFENLELMRTVDAAGGRVILAPELIVPRRPPSTRAFFGQRVRQAYDDLAQPVKLAAMLALGPLLAVAASRRAWRPLLAGVGAVITLAEVGRRRHGGANAFPRTSALWAPLWLAERAVCIWIAVARRLLLGGIRYRDVRLARAATPTRELRRRVWTRRQVEPASAARDGAAA